MPMAPAGGTSGLLARLNVPPWPPRTSSTKLELIPGENEGLIAEDDAGLRFDYCKEGWLGRRPPPGSDEWLWHAKL